MFINFDSIQFTIPITGYGAVLNTAKVECGSTVAVWGCGAVGLATIMGCKAAGASRIIAVDIKQEKENTGMFYMPYFHCLVLALFIALEFGATEFFNPTRHSNPVQVLIEMTDGGLDYTFECVGNVRTMVSCCNIGCEFKMICHVCYSAMP